MSPRRPQRTPTAGLLALATMVAAGPVWAPRPAWAQCSSASNPAPPLPLQADYANQSFGNNPPLSPYSVGRTAENGCDGQPGGVGFSGVTGSPGQPAGTIGSVNTNLTVIGGFNGGVGFDRIGASFYGNGGDGGAGGTGGYTTNADISGGIGGNGGTGAATTVQFQGSFVADPANGYADEALLETSFGGNGGNGGDSSNMGIFLKSGGNAGNGGNGGSLSLGGSGSVQAFRQGVTVSSYGGAGGTGGNAGSADVLDETDGGNGGNGGSGGSVSVRWTSGTITSTVIGILANSTGGSGGDGGAAENGPRTVGGDAGAGGAGGSASVLLGATAAVQVSQNAAYMTTGSGISALSNGGSGGAGGAAATTVGIYGGNGGNGGNGGAAAVTVLGTVTFAGINVPGTVAGQAVLVQSNGGSGGNGDDTGVGEGHAGGGGFAGNGGSASLTLGEAGQASVIQTTGNYAHGALVQSIGGGGGGGGNAGFFGHGGDGAAGGNGGPVDIAAPDGSVLTRGSNSTALIAQSIGGGGGSGGDSNGLALGASLAIGGNGGLGGNGGPVTINLASQVFAASGTLGGGGVLAQSIGGAGGNGGSAIINGASFLALAIGGDSGGGGSGGNLTVGNQALVTTYGDHASGLEVQSIGGGGGKGGSAFSFNVGALPTAAVSVGGRGGGGGPAGSVSVTNKGQIATYGPDAPAVQLQSIGGGGGSGGAAVARAVALAPDKRIPAVSISVATGGSGGSGNTGGRVTLDNSGLITTAGDGAIGVIAQSIGGGGGSGGDSTAASYSGSREGGIAISVSVAVGGTGGSGGTGGDVGITNEGLVATLGQDAYGVFAQSIGGGGGTGGAGDATASSSDAKFSFTSSIGVGGKGGTGGDAGTVSLGNSGAITTRGDGSDGVFAQSIGGGGGAAGGGTATTSGGTLVLSVGVGGSGGAGGNGNSATIANSGSVITRGTDADAISVQSIGGGGGKAGKGGATAGGETTFSNAQALFDILSNGLGVSNDVQKFGDGILGVGETGEVIKATFDELGSIFPQPQAGEAEEGTAQEFDVGVSVGGTGGAAGHGALASVANTGAIATFGAESDGIFAQSIGGGGGDGGAATSTGSASDDGQVQSAIGVGGKGGGGGDGGAVVVTNGSGGSILTQGVTAFGVFAQSVGGGGGAGAMAGVVSGSLKSLSVGVGGNGGGGGDGGSVDVSTGGGTAGSSITTTGKHGIAIFAQSIGGGGGIARTITTDETFDPSKIINNPQGRLGDVQGLALSLGGQAGSSGNGGPVTVTTSGPVTTSGLDAHAILAQSIGGGGGAVIGGQVTSVKGGSSSGHGDGGSVDLQLQPGTKIGTSGDGAYGILAQSIGGGGGIGGDPSGYGALAVGTQGLFMSSSGNGGMVDHQCDRCVDRDQRQRCAGHPGAEPGRRRRLDRLRSGRLGPDARAGRCARRRRRQHHQDLAHRRQDHGERHRVAGHPGTERRRNRRGPDRHRGRRQLQHHRPGRPRDLPAARQRQPDRQCRADPGRCRPGRDPREHPVRQQHHRQHRPDHRQHRARRGQRKPCRQPGGRRDRGRRPWAWWRPAAQCGRRADRRHRRRHDAGRQLPRAGRRRAGGRRRFRARNVEPACRRRQCGARSGHRAAGRRRQLPEGHAAGADGGRHARRRVRPGRPGGGPGLSVRSAGRADRQRLCGPDLVGHRGRRRRAEFDPTGPGGRPAADLGRGRRRPRGCCGASHRGARHRTRPRLLSSQPDQPRRSVGRRRRGRQAGGERALHQQPDQLRASGRRRWPARGGTLPVVPHHRHPDRSRRQRRQPGLSPGCGDAADRRPGRGRAGLVRRRVGRARSELAVR